MTPYFRHQRSMHYPPALCRAAQLAQQGGRSLGNDRNVKKSKKVFLEKYKDRIIRDLNEQPQISTLLKAKSIKSDKGILYQPRTSPPETVVICHFGDMFSDYEKIGDLYSNLIIE